MVMHLLISPLKNVCILDNYWHFEKGPSLKEVKTKLQIIRKNKNKNYEQCI